MPISIGATFWHCPVCKDDSIVDGGELATIGVPFCGECEHEQEMEQSLDPVATVVFLDNGEDYPEYIGVALRPKSTSVKRFQARIAQLYRDWLQTANPPFNLWLEDQHGIIFLVAHRLDVAVRDDEDTEDEEAESVKDAYEDGVCSDCGENIPEDAEPGDECSNCGHVFWPDRDTDDGSENE